MNIYDLIHNKIITIINGLSKQYDWNITDTSSVVIEISADISHGEVACNAAMVLARQARKSPRELADLIVKELIKDLLFIKLEIAGPGFINITLSQESWYNEVAKILSYQDNYGRSDIGKNKKINVEFASPNPTGPMHVGHSRGAIYGDVLARLFEYSGYHVTKEYYVNDAGAQIGHLVKSCLLRYMQVCGQAIVEFPKDCYPGDYLIDAAKELHARYGDSLLTNESSNQIIRDFVLDYMMHLIKDDLALLGVHHDVFFYESLLHKENKIEEVVTKLEESGLIYRGTLEAPKGHEVDEWDQREQLLFKSTNFGDDADRALQKFDGSWTYFAADIAYLQNKLFRKYDELALILGADHIGYQSRITSAFKALKDYPVNFTIKFCQMVNFYKNGEVLKMSKRAGNFETVKQVVESIGKDTLRFMMLTMRSESILDFDLEKVKEMSKDNPVFYVQYAYARAHSVIENSGILEDELANFTNISLLQEPQEMEIIRLLSYWPKQVASATTNHEPHRIVIYLINLATKLHALWSKGKDSKSLRFIIEDQPDLTKARLTLLRAFITILSSGFHLIGVTPTKKM
jgi:arginyl-tRNA synthetase